MKNRIQLLKNIACAAGIVLLTAGSVNADVVVFTDADAEAATTDVGTLSFTPLTANTVLTSQSYTVGGLDLDGDGIFDPFTVSYSIAGATSAGAGDITFNPGGAAAEYDVGPAGSNGGTFNQVGESITFGPITLASGTSSLTGAPLVLNSAVYDSVSYRRWTATSNDRSSITGTSTNIATNALPEVALNDTSFTTEYIPGTGNGDSWNINDIGFTIDVTAAAVVPEPSSLALFGLGGLFLASRRRRA